MVVDFPINIVGKWSDDVVRVPLALHDCGCGISVMFMKTKPTSVELKKIYDVYDLVYDDCVLNKRLPQKANGWKLFGQYKGFEKQYSFDDDDQKTAVYYCKELNQYAMRFHYSDHRTCDPVLAYSIARIGLGARGSNREDVISWCQTLQQYSIRARLKYAEMIDDIVGLESVVDVPHVHLDDDGYYRFGTQRGKIAIQTTTNHLWLFEPKSSQHLNCFVGSLPGMNLDNPKLFNEFIKRTRCLATLKYTFIRV